MNCLLLSQIRISFSSYTLGTLKLGIQCKKCLGIFCEHGWLHSLAEDIFQFLFSSPGSSKYRLCDRLNISNSWFFNNKNKIMDGDSLHVVYPMVLCIIYPCSPNWPEQTFGLTNIYKICLANLRLISNTMGSSNFSKIPSTVIQSAENENCEHQSQKL